MFRLSVLALAVIAIAALAPATRPVHALTQTAAFSTTISFDGVTIKVASSFTVDTTTKTLAGSANVSVVSSTRGLIASKNFTINLAFGTRNNIAFVLKLPVADLAVSCTTSLNVGSPPTVNCFASRNPDLNGDGQVNIIDLGMLVTALGTSAGSLGYNPAYDLNADGKITPLDASILLGDYDAPVLA